MQAGKSGLRISDFVDLKEHLFSMVSISALLTSSVISTEVTEQGINEKRYWDRVSYPKLYRNTTYP